MKCPVCGGVTPDGSEFCSVCGSRITTPADENRYAAETMVTGSVWPRLTVISGVNQGQEFRLQGRTRLGRAQDNEIILDDPKVSRHHAVFNLETEGWVITDLGSANGTFVNGQRIEEPYRLQNGDRISVGDVELGYAEPVTEQIPAAPATAPVAPAQPVQKKGGIPKWVWIGCAALLVLGLLIGCMVAVVVAVLPQLGAS